MGSQAKQIHLLVLLAALWLNEAAPNRVVQLVAENPSPFVSADPDDPKYIISLFEDVETAAAVVPEVQSVRSSIMTNAAGQQFNCSIPSSPPGVETALSQLDPDTTPAYNLIRSPHELLESLVDMCMYRQDGLWTYEVCHRKHVRQFRQVSLQPGSVLTVDVSAAANADVEGLVDAALSGDVNKLLGGVMGMLESGKKAEDFTCGRYTGDENQNEAVMDDTSSSGHPLKYVSHKYSGGASCVLTGQPRTAEVRYTCVRDTQENVVLSVREFPTCNYVVVVSTPFLCKHPAFVPPDEDLRLISCVPIDPAPDSPKKQAAMSKDAAATPAAAAAAAAGSIATPTAAAKQTTAAELKDAASGSRHQPKIDRRGRKLSPSPAYVEEELDTADDPHEQPEYDAPDFEWSYGDDDDDDEDHSGEGYEDVDDADQYADPYATSPDEGGIPEDDQQRGQQQPNQQRTSTRDMQQAAVEDVQQRQEAQQQRAQQSGGHQPKDSPGSSKQHDEL